MLIKLLTRKVIILPIAPSGAGKTTLFNYLKTNVAENLEIASFDIHRIERYGNDYGKAFQESLTDPDFKDSFYRKLEDIMREGKPVYIDNTNLTPVLRAPFIDLAAGYLYSTVGISFPNANRELLLERQRTRTDKVIPESVVDKHLGELELPEADEFDIFLEYA